MNTRLSICIPTYNRAPLLQECLKSADGQAGSVSGVEIVVIDNASQDDTERVASEFARRHAYVRYVRNKENLGYAGNQVKCFEHASGDYIAILCDDDLYLPGTVETILSVIARGEYAFLALNYYSFLRNKLKVFGSGYAPEKDVEFSRAFDIMNYPSVGHFSGFIFNATAARTALARLRATPIEYYEKHRGIITDIAVRSTLSSKLPSYFIGKRTLAVRVPVTLDYDSLQHLCIDYYAYYNGLYREGLITDADLAYRRGLVMEKLPRAIIANTPRMDTRKIGRITRELSSLFPQDRKFRHLCLPLLYLAKSGLVRLIYAAVRETAYYVKYANQRLRA